MPSKYIEIRGPFHIPDPKAASKIKAEIKRLAKEHPKAEFILREVNPSKKRGESVFSAAFKGLAETKQAVRAKEVKLDYNPRRNKQIDSPVKAREAKIKSLNAFKTVEFTFSGEVASPEWKSWQSVDISLSKEKVWDPLRSKGQHFSGFEGYNQDAHLVKKFVGGTTSATKKLDALLDRISEYGRKSGAKRTSVDAGFQYVRDKAAQFEAEQRILHPKKTPINMITPERETRMQRLTKNYGTPPATPGKVELISTSEKKIKPQVPVSATTPTFEKKIVTLESAPRRTKTGNAPSPVITPLKKKTINDASLKLSNKLKQQLETNQTTVTKRTEGVTRTAHIQVIKAGIVQPKGQGYTTKFDETLEQVKSVREGKGPAHPEGVDPEKRGQVKTGLRDTVTDNTPVGITLKENSQRDFDTSSVHSQKGDPDRGLWPEPSGDREDMIRQQRYDVKTSKYIGQGIPKGQKVISAPAQQSIEGKVYNPKTTQFSDKQVKTKTEKLTKGQKRHRRFKGLKVDRPVVIHELGRVNVTQGGTSSNPSTSTKGFAVVKGTAPVVHPFSRLKSALTSFDKLKPAEFGDKEVFTSPGEEFKKSHVEVELGDDVGGGSHVAVDKGSYLEKQAKGLSDELAVQEHWDKNKKWPKGTLPPSALARKPWITTSKDEVRKQVVTPIDDKGRVATSDVLYGDSADYDDAGHRKASSTVSHVKEPIPPRVFGSDPTYRSRKKPLTVEQQARAERLHAEDLKGDTTKVVLGKDKYGRKTESFITKYSQGKIDPVTRTRKGITIEDQLKRESLLRKQRGGLTKAQLAQKEYAKRRNTEIKTGDLVFKGETPGTEFHGPQKHWTKPKAKSTALTSSQRIRGAFKAAKPITKAVLPPLLGIGGLALSPLFAKYQLEAKGIKDPTATQFAKETAAVFVSAPRVLGGEGDKPGWMQKVKWNKKGVEGGRRKSGPIPGAGGPNTPYASIKAWMFSKPKTTLPYKSDMATKSNR